MTLTEFLLARIAEDERYADAARGLLGIETPWHKVEVLRERGLTRADARHVARWTPARVLAECEAKRRIVTFDFREYLAHGEAIRRILALPYADHPDYREEWKP